MFTKGKLKMSKRSFRARLPPKGTPSMVERVGGCDSGDSGDCDIGDCESGGCDSGDRD